MATGIKEKVAILGTGCSKFGERWDAGSPELMAEAFDKALAGAGMERKQIEAAWFGCYGDAINVGNSLRGTTYAVASGAVDIALEMARAPGKTDVVTIKSLQLLTSSGCETQMSGWDGSYVPDTRDAAACAYKEAGIDNPREQLSLTEVHHCFSITELVTTEDLFLFDHARAVFDVLDGKLDRDGAVSYQGVAAISILGLH